jgi:hypothetical protein
VTALRLLLTLRLRSASPSNAEGRDAERSRSASEIELAFCVVVRFEFADGSTAGFTAKAQSTQSAQRRPERRTFISVASFAYFAALRETVWSGGVVLQF